MAPVCVPNSRERDIMRHCFKGRLSRHSFAAIAIIFALQGAVSAQPARVIGSIPGGATTHLGYAVAGINGNFLVGAPLTAVGGVGRVGTAGFYTAAGVLSRTHTGNPALYPIPGGTSTDHLGLGVGNIGDVTGDGLDDYVAGTPQRSRPGARYTGGFRLYDGLTGAMLADVTGTVADVRLGVFSSRARPFAGGTGSFVVGGNGEYRVYSYTPATGAVTSVVFASANPLFGAVVEGVGDFSGLGFGDEIAVRTNTNMVEVRNAAGAILMSINDPAGWTFGDRLESIPTLLLPDGTVGPGLAISDPGWSNFTGRVQIYRFGNPVPVATITGSAVGDQLGMSLDSGSDLDGSGSDNLVIGATGGGYVRIYDGFNGVHPRDVTQAMRPGFASSVAIIGDNNGDGFNDFVVGSPDFGAGLAGFVDLFYGGPIASTLAIATVGCGSPSLVLNGLPIPGSVVSFSLSGTAAGDSNQMWDGPFNLTGANIGFCELLYLGAGATFVAGGITPAGAPWSPVPAFTVPTVPGFSRGYQCVTVPSAGPAVLSNGLQVTIGW